ncbi:MAG: transcriptional repressor [Methylacidiphilales bacterium]|nr:transcriptional repressor [Candidatus Methylacidiphilales bacterium]
MNERPRFNRQTETMAPDADVLPVGRLRDPAIHHGRTGCPFHDVRQMLKDSGLRPTRQRLALGWLLFAKGDRHISAEMLHEEAQRARFPVSLATVYNTLHQFTGAGLLRELAIDGSRAFFDTNVHDHHHFFLEEENQVMDVSSAAFRMDRTPEPPLGYEVERIDVVVRLRRKGAL